MSFDSILDDFLKTFIQSVLRQLNLAGLLKGDEKAIKEQKLMLLRIYTFRVNATPDEENWIRRLNEEMNAFSIFKKYKNTDRLPHFKTITPDLKNKRLIKVLFRGEDLKERIAIIRLPIDYPRNPPSSIITEDRYLEAYTRHTDDEKCLGKLVTWEPYKMGISHWLFMVEEYLFLKYQSVNLKKIKPL